MPIYESKRKVYVTPIQGLSLNYGFLTNVDPSVGSALGHTDIGAAIPPATVFGANAPRPAKATRRFADGVKTSYIDVGSITSARAAGWSVGRARVRRGGQSALAIVVYVSVQGIKYAWHMPLRLYNRIQADLPALGISVGTPSDTDLVFGASFPKPPRANKVELGTDGEDSLSTFVDPTVTLPNGWSASGSDHDPLQQL